MQMASFYPWRLKHSLAVEEPIGVLPQLFLAGCKKALDFDQGTVMKAGLHCARKYPLMIERVKLGSKKSSMLL